MNSLAVINLPDYPSASAILEIANFKYCHFDQREKCLSFRNKLRFKISPAGRNDILCEVFSILTTNLRVSCDRLIFILYNMAESHE